MKNGQPKKIARPKKSVPKVPSPPIHGETNAPLEDSHQSQPELEPSFLKDTNQDAIIATDKELHITSWDWAAEAMFGWQTAEVLGKQPSSQIRASVLGFLNEDLVMSSIVENTFWAGKVSITRKDGLQINTTVNIRIFWDDRGEFGGLVAIFRANTLSEDKKQIPLLDKIVNETGQKSAASVEKLHRTIKEIVQAMAYIVGVRDPYTAGHQRRVAQLSFDIARFMGLHNERGEGLIIAAFVHDIGKIHIPEDILSKPGKLTKSEFDLLKEHTRIGYDILKNIEFPWPVAKIVLQHHERMNGSGYPSGISGDQIMVEARILAVADVVEAMSSDRPYRRALSLEEAFLEINNNKGILYDPKVVEVCMKVFHNKGFSLN
jgi:PAS domain S-box-containing protein/putative nucleotidyltransferase with HDIG domain